MSKPIKKIETKHFLDWDINEFVKKYNELIDQVEYLKKEVARAKKYD